MRIRYSLRWLLIGVTLVCSLLAAFAYRAERAWRQAAAVRIINEELGTDAVAYDFQSRQTLDQSANWSYDIKELTPRDFGLGIDFWHGAIQVGHHPYPSPDDEVRFFVALGQLPRLESLELRVPQVRAEHLRQLTCQRSLRFLVWDGEFSDESFAELGDFRQLEAIEFANDHNPDSLANVTDWRPIDAWQTLRFFEAKRAGLGDDAAVHLGNLKKLQQVHVAGNRIGDRGAAALGQLPQLEVLSLEENNVTSSGTTSWGSLKRLRNLDLSGNPLDDRCLTTLGRLPHLQLLDLRGMSLDGGEFANPQAFRRLYFLAIEGDGLTEAGWRGISELPSLKILSLSGKRVLPLYAIEPTAFQTLERLHVGKCAFSESTWLALTSLRKLVAVQFSGTTDLDSLILHPGPSKLCEISFTDCALSEEQLFEILRLNPRLQWVRVYRNTVPISLNEARKRFPNISFESL